MNKNIEPDELVRRFQLSIAQYTTIDKNKHKSFGTLTQGFFTLKKGENARIVPFMLVSSEEVKKLEKVIRKFKTEFFAVSLVQHYIHYQY